MIKGLGEIRRRTGLVRVAFVGWSDDLTLFIISSG
jgi:hypothetical protein